MYLKSNHTQLSDGGHQWEVVLFCSAEANSIRSVDITPKSKGSKVVPNDAKPRPTAYTMIYALSKYDQPPFRFTATITFDKTNETKTVSVPANMATDRKRRRADGSVDDDDNDNNTSQEVEQPPQLPEKDRKKGKKFLCFQFGGKSKPLSEKDELPQSKGCCGCTVM